MTKEDLKDIKTQLLHVGAVAVGLTPGVIAGVNDHWTTTIAFAIPAAIGGYIVGKGKSKIAAAAVWGAIGLIFGVITYIAV